MTQSLASGIIGAATERPEEKAVRLFIAVLVFALFAALQPATAAAGPLKAGVARVDITPPIGLNDVRVRWPKGRRNRRS